MDNHQVAIQRLANRLRNSSLRLRDARDERNVILADFLADIGLLSPTPQHKLAWITAGTGIQLDTTE